MFPEGPLSIVRCFHEASIAAEAVSVNGHPALDRGRDADAASS